MSEPIIIALIALAGVIIQSIAPPLLKQYLPRKSKKPDSGKARAEQDEPEPEGDEPTEIDIFKSKLFFK